MSRRQNPIHATVVGEVTSYFEWLGAGRYRPDPRSGAMHGGESPVREILYGSDGQNLYVRIDAEPGARFAIEYEDGPAQTTIAAKQIIEMSAPLARTKFRVTVTRDGLPPLRVPADNWIEV